MGMKLCAIIQMTSNLQLVDVQAKSSRLSTTCRYNYCHSIDANREFN